MRPAKTDLDKVRSIYQWLIWNIEYDKTAYKNGNKRVNRSNEDILVRSKAICWGYATLFKSMCEVVGIDSEILSGYSKVPFTAKPKMEEPNHAWNSVKIDGKWYLLDTTWDSGYAGQESDFEKQFEYNYFLTPPQYFIVNHLPAEPNWQLLECPISPEEFQLPFEKITQLAVRADCQYISNLGQSAELSEHDKRLSKAIKTYEYNPTKSNQRELAHAHIDYEAYLSEKAEQLQVAQKYDSLALIQAEMIRLCETASSLTDLFTNQLENCAYNYFNYAVTLTQTTANSKEQSLQDWKTILTNFETAQLHLKDLQQNIFTQNALTQSDDYIEYVKSQIKALE